LKKIVKEGISTVAKRENPIEIIPKIVFSRKSRKSESFLDESEGIIWLLRLHMHDKKAENKDF